MKIEFAGMELEVKDLREQSEEKQGKARFVQDYLEPLLKTVNSDIKTAIYMVVDGFELVVVYYDESLYEAINVSADSWQGITYDVVKAIL